MDMFTSKSEWMDEYLNVILKIQYTSRLEYVHRKNIVWWVPLTSSSSSRCCNNTDLVMVILILLPAASIYYYYTSTTAWRNILLLFLSPMYFLLRCRVIHFIAIVIAIVIYTSY